MYTDKAFTGGPALAEEVPAFWALAVLQVAAQSPKSRHLFCKKKKKAQNQKGLEKSSTEAGPA